MNKSYKRNNLRIRNLAFNANTKIERKEEIQLIHILQIGLSHRLGGIETCIMNYYKHIDRSEFQFDFVDIYGKGFTFSNEIKQLGGKIYILPDCRRSPVSAAYQLRRILKKGKYDVVHINVLSAANLVPTLVSCIFRKNFSVIVHSHNTDVPSGIFRKLLDRINRNILRRMPVERWACGIAAGRWMWGDSFDGKNVLPNAIDTTCFSFDANARERIRKECEFCEEDCVLGFVGRLVEQKNVLFLVEIMSELCKISPHYKLLIVGDGELKGKLKLKLKQNQLEDFVYFAGVQRNIAPWYSAMDAFVLPSCFEGFPIVGIEAQACGLPCFISDKVSTELKLTDCVFFLPINQKGKIWANEMSGRLKTDRSNCAVFPLEYNMTFAAKQLEKKYFELVEGNRMNV